MDDCVAPKDAAVNEENCERVALVVGLKYHFSTRTKQIHLALVASPALEAPCSHAQDSVPTEVSPSCTNDSVGTRQGIIPSLELVSIFGEIGEM